jgi:outer membrane protein assembly factor BamB
MGSHFLPRVRYAACLIAATLAAQADPAPTAPTSWPRWRGPNDQGSQTQGAFPTQLDPAKAAWKAPLPGKGCSTPIVAGQRIFLTAPVNGRDAALAFDLQGRSLWQTPLGPETPGKHRNGSGSNPSPTTDGHSLFVHFKSGTLAALDFNGSVRWQTNLVEAYGKDTLYWDHGTSPVLTTSAVIMTRMHQGESWLAAFDKSTGALLWKVARNFKTPTEGDHAYTTPLVIQHQGREAILVWGAQHVTVHSPDNGQTLWSCGNFNPASKAYWPAVASPVVVGDIAIIPYGRSDRGEPRLHGIRLGGSGDVTETHRAWQRQDTGTFVPTPAANGNQVVLVRDRGEVEAIDAATGRSLWKEAFPKASSNFYASPLIAGNHLYAAREDGKIFVADLNNGFRLLGEHDLGERVVASPIALNNGLLIRGEQHLHCFLAP